jgi:uncharacterized membrane protein
MRELRGRMALWILIGFAAFIAIVGVVDMLMR